MGDIEVLARTAFGEARGEGDAGLIGVMWCIRNRVDADLGNDGKPDWWGEGYEGVCLKPKQFSCWNLSDPNRAKLLAVDDSNDLFRHIKDLAGRVIRGEVPDPTNGATHYLTRGLFLSAPSDHWCHSKPPCAQIGQHVFFRGV